MKQPLRILAFEPYDAGSHRAVRKSISRHSRHNWQWFTLAGHSWKWRMRTAAITLARLASQQWQGSDPDLIFATSLLSAADLRALLPAPWRQIPLVLYMHENQAAYPIEPDRGHSGDIHFPLTNLTSLLAADAVIWNSQWNSHSFQECITRLAKPAPDLDIHAAINEINKKSTVIWPPVEIDSNIPGNQRTSLPDVPTIVWPHRWEFDKGPDTLLQAALELQKHQEAKWIILGGGATASPPSALIDFQRAFADHIIHFGHVDDRAHYLELISSADWVLSTARHEYFGIAVVECLLAGCMPWLPDRLSYPELLPVAYQNQTPMNPPNDVQHARRAIRDHLEASRAQNAVALIDEHIEVVAQT